MRRIIFMAALALLPAGCRGREPAAAAPSDPTTIEIAQLRERVADLEHEVDDLGGELDALGPPGDDEADDGPAVREARYAATSWPARARSIRSRVRFTPKMATKEPKRGPVD